MTDEEARNLQTVQRWGELYNSDAPRMVTECYSPDCQVEVKGAMRYRGHSTFVALEEAVSDVAPNRRGLSERVISCGDTVVVQGVLVDPDKGPDWTAPFCVILTFKDGLIVKDETYMDLAMWPAPRLTPEQLTHLGVELTRPS